MPDQPSAIGGVLRRPFTEQAAFFRQKLGRLVPTARWDDLIGAEHDTAKFQVPEVASKTNTPVFTIGALPFVLRSYELNLACDVQPRLLVGVERIIIVDRNETLKATVEAVPYATYNPFQRAKDRTRQAVVIQHGTGAGRRVRIEAPTAAQKRPTGIEQNQNIAEWPLDFTPMPTSAGNDQWKITLT